MKFAAVCCCLWLATGLLAQSESEYYQNPKDTVLSSRFLGTQKSITVILPKSFSKSRSTKFPLIIVFDRQNKRNFRQAFEDINYLVSFDEMPEAVVIGISTDNNQRFFETSLLASAEQARGEKLIRFLFEELIPWASSALNCGSNRVLIGHSRFGYFSSYILANQLPHLTAVVSLSPFFVQPHVNVTDSLVSSLSTRQWHHTVYYRFVTGDSATDTNEFSLMQSALSRARVPESFNWKGTAFYNARHMAVPGLGLMPSQLEIFDYWSDATIKMLQTEALFTPEVYQQFKQQMKRHYGDSLGLGLSVLNGIGYKFYNKQQYEAARTAWQILLQEYPMFAAASISIAKSYEQEGKPVLAAAHYKQAAQLLADNSFYPTEVRQEMLTAIGEALKRLGH